MTIEKFGNDKANRVKYPVAKYLGLTVYMIICIGLYMFKHFLPKHYNFYSDKHHTKEIIIFYVKVFNHKMLIYDKK